MPSCAAFADGSTSLIQIRGAHPIRTAIARWITLHSTWTDSTLLFHKLSGIFLDFKGVNTVVVEGWVPGAVEYISHSVFEDWCWFVLFNSGLF